MIEVFIQYQEKIQYVPFVVIVGLDLVLNLFLDRHFFIFTSQLSGQP